MIALLVRIASEMQRLIRRQSRNFSILLYVALRLGVTASEFRNRDCVTEK